MEVQKSRPRLKRPRGARVKHGHGEKSLLRHKICLPNIFTDLKCGMDFLRNHFEFLMFRLQRLICYWVSFIPLKSFGFCGSCWVFLFYVCTIIYILKMYILQFMDKDKKNPLKHQQKLEGDPGSSSSRQKIKLLIHPMSTLPFLVLPVTSDAADVTHQAWPFAVICLIHHFKKLTQLILDTCW